MYLLSVGSRSEADSETFRTFRRQLIHNSLTVILECFGEHMEVPEVVVTPDNHYRRAIYGIGPYIADYQEQVLIAAVVSNWCVRYVAISYPTCRIRCSLVYLDVWHITKILKRKGHAFGLESIQTGFASASARQICGNDGESCQTLWYESCSLSSGLADNAVAYY